MAWMKTQMLADWWHSDIITYTVLTLLVVLASIWFIRRQRKINLINRIPGPKGIPVLGSAWEVNVEPVEQFRRINKYCDHGEVTRIWLGNIAYALLSSPRAVEAILSSQKHITKSYDYSFLYPWLGTGLLTSTGKKWRSRRKLLTPAFHFKILEDFVEVFNSQSNTFVQKLRKKANGKPFDISSDVALCALDIICETAMGCTVGAQENSESEYVTAVLKANRLIMYRALRPWLHPNIIFWLSGYGKEFDAYLKILHDFTKAAIRSRREIYLKNKAKQDSEKSEDELIGKKRRLAFLDLLLQYSDEGTPLSDEDIREEVDTFMFEGHDTTAAAINWVLHLLGNHQDIQAKVHEELDAIFQKSDRPVTSEDLREMKYLENCIKEALRLYPSVPVVARELQEDIVVGDHLIPAGVTAMVMTYRMHQDPEQFPNPEIFDPDRFLLENSQGRHPYAYVPFSAGPRNCIGQKFAMMEEKIVVSNFLRNFRVESDTKTSDMKLQFEVILRPVGGNHVKLFSRE